MPNLNKVLIIGNLTRDPELKYTPSGTPVCQISIAVNERWKAKDGTPMEKASFIDCVAFANSAENLSMHLKKGRQILIEGKLKQETWEEKESGQKRSKIKVIIDSWQFVDSLKKDDACAPCEDGEPKQAANSASKPHEDMATDDIPF